MAKVVKWGSHVEIMAGRRVNTSRGLMRDSGGEEGRDCDGRTA